MGRESSSAAPPAVHAQSVITTTTVLVESTTPPARTPTHAREDPTAVPPAPVAVEQRQALVVALAGVELPGAPVDPAPAADPGTTVLHPVREVVVFTEPGGPALARLPVRQVLAPTWVPVVDRRPGWALVLLPGRPHPGGAAPVGWVHLDGDVVLDEVDRRIVIDRGTLTVSVVADLARVSTSSPAAPATAPTSGVRSFVAVGATGTEGLPWLVGVLWPLVASPTRICTGPLGGIGVPGLPETSPLGTSTADGCVDTPPSLRHALRTVPAGAPVIIR
ncbi:hypothetical protein [Saccharothrix sp.]|uniref:hypothetical protein n=1 Tax=Saccharothrix sp. TaxID=1873460 RepID=UPI00281198CE|nr:hypothetical protein [Saccharothrix sp.]